jgi:hypothetical protein
MSEDILVYDRQGKPTALVVVKAYPETSMRWATERLPDILDDGGIPPYLVLVARDYTYFWHDPVNQPSPVGAVATDDLFQKHLRDLGKPAASVHYSTLEMIAFNWASSATRDSARIPESLGPIGFTDAIRDGRVELQTAA